MAKASIRFLLLICIFFAGCTVGPDYERPETAADEVSSWTYKPDAWPDGNSIETASPWWMNFGDPVTEELVKTALENNTQLRQAAARVLQAQALLDESRGGRGPDISYSAGRTRAKTSVVSPTGSGRTESIATTYSQDLSISYITDLFGRLKRTEQARYAEFLAAGYRQQALRQAIISSVIRARVRISTLERLVDLAEFDIENWTRSLEIIQRRYESGLAGPVDIYLARENLAAARAQLPDYQQQLAQARTGLDVLLARPPATGRELPETLAVLPDLQPIPTGIPAAVLDNRPDLRATELVLAAATERVGVNMAALYPDLTLTASGGYRSSELEDLLDSDGLVYSAVIRLAAPIWQGGRLRARVDLAQAQAEEAAAAYAENVLTALQEVEDALITRQKVAERIVLLEQRLEHAVQAEDLARERYSRGVENVLTVLETERRRSGAQRTLINTQGALWQAQVELHLALGGDWDVLPGSEKDSTNLSNGQYEK